jgi:hypothetical protein
VTSVRRLALVGLVLVAAGCAGTTPENSSPPSKGVESADEAMAVVRARTPLFDGLKRKDPNVIGQGSWWDATANELGFLVSIEVGWGDCQAGCIDRHTWAWDVETDGLVTFARELGAPLPVDVVAGLRDASTAQGIGGWAIAGPTCPVERPDDPACAPRMVEGATLHVKGGDGREVATFTTDGSGLFRIPLEPAEYTVEASPAAGLTGTPGPATVEVESRDETWLDLAYDTGIR